MREGRSGGAGGRGGRAAGREHCMGSPPSNGARPTLISKAEMAEPGDADIGKIANRKRPPNPLKEQASDRRSPKPGQY